MNSSAIVTALKKELKKRGVTYATLAKNLKLSEAAVKRLFSEENFSLRRLDQICAAINVGLDDLVLAAQTEGSHSDEFSEDAEEMLAADPEMLLTLYFLLLGYSPKEILRELRCDSDHLYKIGRQLEEIGLVEVLPRGQFRVKVKKSTRWRAGGLLVKRYAASIRDEFFATEFSGTFQHQDFLTGALSKESFAIIKRKAEELFRQFDQLSEIDARLPDTHTEVIWLYAGLRPWAPVDAIRRRMLL